MWKNKKVSVVMPAYNEEAGITKVVSDFKNIPEVDEVIVVNNNSRDKTAELAKKAGAKVILERKQGYGYACVRGLKEASGDYIALVDSDNTFAPKDLNKFFAYIDEFDLVKGGRTYEHMIDDAADWGLFLKYGNWFVAKLLQVLYNGPSMKDAGGTYRMIKKSALKKILPYLTRMDSILLPDMVTISLRKKLTVLEIPIHYRRRIGFSKLSGTKLDSFNVGLMMIKVIIANRFKNLDKKRS
jgi:glycosyltransferase involved in cell wall biosynthesis